MKVLDKQYWILNDVIFKLYKCIKCFTLNSGFNVAFSIVKIASVFLWVKLRVEDGWTIVEQLFFRAWHKFQASSSTVYLLEGLWSFILFFSCPRVFLNIGILKLYIIGLTREWEWFNITKMYFEKPAKRFGWKRLTM